MATLTLRLVKGSSLTNQELDDNFTNLNADIASRVSSTGPSTITANSASPALTLTQTGSGDAFVVEDAASDTTPFVINTSGRVLASIPTALTVDGTVQSAVQSSTVSAYLSNANGTTSQRAHWRLAVNDAEVANIGCTSTTYNVTVGGTIRQSITENGQHTFSAIGTGGLASVVASISGTNIGGATTNYGIFNNITFGQTATVRGEGFQTTLGTEAAAFTLAEMGHYKATQGVFGAASAVTNQIGFLVDSNLIGATNNYGINSSHRSLEFVYGWYSNQLSKWFLIDWCSNRSWFK
jgi:hypothetical protein